MRSTINHTPPAIMQACPADNTTSYVSAQVALWVGLTIEGVTAPLIHTQSALEIASWWQAPGNTFAPFASTGTITEGLAEDIDTALTNDLSQYMTTAERNALVALSAYLDACTLPEVWSVGHNVPGYLPTGDVAVFISHASAVRAYTDMIDAAPDDLIADDGCTCDDDEMCDYDMLKAIVGAHKADDIRPVRDGAELQLTLTPDSVALGESYWLTWCEDHMTYGEYLSTQY